MAEIHIASCVAYALPDRAAEIERAIRATSVAEVPMRDERGRIVVLIEAASAARVLETMDAIRALDGVLAIHLAYQHAESESEMQEAP
jgi:periplasmic nitrate reductase NapD